MRELDACRCGALMELAWQVSRHGYRARMDVREVAPFLVIENPKAWGPDQRVTVRTGEHRPVWPALRCGKEKA